MAGAAISIGAPFVGSATIEAPVRAGDVIVTSPTNVNTRVTEGDSNTVFALRLPAGAECPGDSANDGWRVQSFVVPAEFDPARLQYGATRPDGDNMYALYTVEGRPYAQALTAQNPGAGEPGLILDVPPLSFAVFTPDLLPTGMYRIGIACTFFADAARYWDATIELTEDSEIQPGERRWELAVTEGDPGDATLADSGGSTTSNRTLGLIGIATAALLVVGAASATRIARRRRPPRHLAKEHLA